LQFGDGYFVTADMIPYPEPFQSIFQKRRLGTLGFEWRPPSVDFAVGPTYNATTGEFQTIPIIDHDRWEPLPEITDFVELEPENEVVSDDTDSEYNGMDEYSSGEQEILSGDSSGASYSSAEIDMDNPTSAVHKCRSRRKKKKSEVSDKHLIFFMLSSVFFYLFSFYYILYRLILLLHLVG
jgi:PH-interacting protein